MRPCQLCTIYDGILPIGARVIQLSGDTWLLDRYVGGIGNGSVNAAAERI